MVEGAAPVLSFFLFLSFFFFLSFFLYFFLSISFLSFCRLAVHHPLYQCIHPRSPFGAIVLLSVEGILAPARKMGMLVFQAPILSFFSFFLLSSVLSPPRTRTRRRRTLGAH